MKISYAEEPDGLVLLVDDQPAEADVYFDSGMVALLMSESAQHGTRWALAAAQKALEEQWPAAVEQIKAELLKAAGDVRVLALPERLKRHRIERDEHGRITGMVTVETDS